MLRTNSFHRLIARTLVSSAILLLVSIPAGDAQEPAIAQQADTDSPTLDPELSDRRLQRVYDSAMSLLERDDLVNALPLLQSILDHPRDAMYYINPEDRDQAVSLKGKVLQTLSRLTPSERGQYQLLFEAAAEEVLDEAETVSELSALEEVVRRYYFTKTGAKAARRLAELYFDRGNALAAALTFQRLLSENRIARSERPKVLLQTSLALRMTGLQDECLEYLKRLQQETQTLTLEVRGSTKEYSTTSIEGINWLDQFSPLREDVLADAKPDDWRIFGGDADRNTASQAAPPLREESWEFRTVPLSEFDEPQQLELVESELRSLARRFESTRYLQLPAMHPLMIGEVVVFRSLGNLKAVNVHNGEMLWETYAIDTEFTSLLDDLDRSSYSNQPQISDLQAYIMQRTWRDMTSGTLASDGELVFSVEEQGLLEVNRAGSYSQQTDYNKLMAYELASGKAIWELGGAADQFTTGLRFLGPPLVQGNMLYCIASRKEEMLLIALKNKELPNGRRTVRWLWEQPLPTPIASELEKQTPLWELTGLSPSYTNGILVCPIAHGTVIGYDLARGIFSWQFRYTEEFSHSKQTLSKLDRLQSEYGISPEDESRWIDSVARIAQGRVLVTPCDSSDLYCLNLSDGAPVWSAPRQDDLYVACIHDRKVILVGRREIHARDLTTGRDLWSVETPLPSGRGYRAEGDYYLPLSDASIAVIDLEEGILKASIPSAHDRVAGNLVAANGVVVSQTKDRIFRYLSDSELEQRIAEQGTGDAAVLRGELALLAGHRQTAIDEFVAAYEDQPDSRLHQILTSTLIEGMRQDFPKHEKYLPLLRKLTADSPQASQLQAIVAEGQMEAGNLDEAFRQFLGLIDHPDFILHRRHARIRSDRWVRGRLKSIYQQADASAQTLFAKQFQEYSDRLLAENDTVKISRAASILRGLPGSDRLALYDVQHLDAYTDSLELEQQLIQLTHSADEKVRREALARHFRLLMKLQKIPAAATLREELLDKHAEEICLEEMTGKELAEWGLENRLLRDYLAKTQHAWTARPIHVAPSSESSIQAILHRIPVYGESGLWEGWSFNLATERPPRLLGFDRLGEKRIDLPLSNVKQNPNSLIADRRLYLHGHLAVLVFSDQFYVLDLFQDGDVSMLHGPHDLKEPLVGFHGNSPQSSIQIERVVDANGHPRQQVYDLFDEPLGNVALIDSDLIVYQKDRHLIAMDWRNGELLWEQQIGSHGQTISADANVIACLPQGGETITVHRTSDGQPVAEFPLSGVSRWSQPAGRLLIVHEEIADGEPDWQLAAYDPVTRKRLWSQAVSEKSLFQQATPQFVGTLAPESRQFRLIRIENGEVLASFQIQLDDEGEEPPDLVAFSLHYSRSGFLLSTLEQPSEENQPFVVSGDEYYFPQVNGEFIRLAPDGEILWRQRIQNQAYDPDQPEASPLIAFLVKRRQARRGFISSPQETSIELLDRKTGDIIFSDTNSKHLSRLSIQVMPEQNLVKLSGNRSAYTVKFGEDPNNSPTPPE
ncbi:MAG: PQQ-binding-like beta-propeller repeat protein [Planctomycetaceae bacterium]|nr:PQQ-binding-like beta-propeller repeat protein [Planctomycetaceae bacterium]